MTFSQSRQSNSIKECVSSFIRRSVCTYVKLLFLGLLGATYGCIAGFFIQSKLEEVNKHVTNDATIRSSTWTHRLPNWESFPLKRLSVGVSRKTSILSAWAHPLVLKIICHKTSWASGLIPWVLNCFPSNLSPWRIDSSPGSRITSRKTSIIGASPGS